MPNSSTCDDCSADDEFVFVAKKIVSISSSTAICSSRRKHPPRFAHLCPIPNVPTAPAPTGGGGGRNSCNPQRQPSVFLSSRATSPPLPPELIEILPEAFRANNTFVPFKNNSNFNSNIHPDAADNADNQGEYSNIDDFALKEVNPPDRGIYSNLRDVSNMNNSEVISSRLPSYPPRSDFVDGHIEDDCTYELSDTVKSNSSCSTTSSTLSSTSLPSQNDIGEFSIEKQSSAAHILDRNNFEKSKFAPCITNDQVVPACSNESSFSTYDTLSNYTASKAKDSGPKLHGDSRHPQPLPSLDKYDFTNANQSVPNSPFTVRRVHQPQPPPPKRCSSFTVSSKEGRVDSSEVTHIIKAKASQKFPTSEVDKAWNVIGIPVDEAAESKYKLSSSFPCRESSTRASEDREVCRHHCQSDGIYDNFSVKPSADSVPQADLSLQLDCPPLQPVGGSCQGCPFECYSQKENFMPHHHPFSGSDSYLNQSSCGGPVAYSVKAPYAVVVYNRAGLHSKLPQPRSPRFVRKYLRRSNSAAAVFHHTSSGHEGDPRLGRPPLPRKTRRGSKTLEAVPIAFNSSASTASQQRRHHHTHLYHLQQLQHIPYSNPTESQRTQVANSVPLVRQFHSNGNVGYTVILPTNKSGQEESDPKAVSVKSEDINKSKEKSGKGFSLYKSFKNLLR